MEFNQIHRYLSFTVSGSESTIGFCNISIPQQMLYAETDQWLILVGGLPVTYTAITNNTHTWIYFTYPLSIKKVYIFGTNVIPEFPTSIYIAMSLIITILAIATAKKILLQKHRFLTIVSRD